MREEAGTPAIVGAIKAGLVFQLKQVHGSHMEALKTIYCNKYTKVQMWPETTAKLKLKIQALAGPQQQQQ